MDGVRFKVQLPATASMMNSSDNFTSERYKENMVLWEKMLIFIDPSNKK